MTQTAAASIPIRTLPFPVAPSVIGSDSIDALIQHISNKKHWLDQLLWEHGAVLFQGFAVNTPVEFGQVAHALFPKLKPYIEGNSPRTRVTDNVYTSTEYPAEYRITLHHELSYAKSPPPRIVFHCQTPPGTGGETPIVDCRKVYTAMPDDLRTKFETLGVKYTKCMHGESHGLGKSWMQYFETDDRSQVEEYLAENDIAYEWTAKGSLRTWAIRPGTRKHPVTGEMVWFNQANLWHITNVDAEIREQLIQSCGPADLPTQAYYGDGTPIGDEDLDRVRKMLWENAVSNPWQAGDVLVLDNFLVAHGRNSYTGPRKILVAMG